MPLTLERFGIAELSIEERLELADMLWDSVAEDLQNRPLSDELREELERRLALSEADPSRGTPFEEVFARARARHGK